MDIIPAIDIRGGKCVMLTQGLIEQETIYSTDCVFIAKMWQAKGAKRLHIVDLDGAFCGTTRNWELIEQIRASFAGIIQLGGGLRDLACIEKILNIGIDRIIIGTLLIYNPEMVKKIMNDYGDKVIGAIDTFEGRVAIGGWKEKTNTDSKEFLVKIREMGIKEIILTDISKDGTLSGPNIAEIKKMLKDTDLKVIISGGVGTLDDVKKVKQLEKDGVSGLIIGKALYNESVKYEDAVGI